MLVEPGQVQSFVRPGTTNCTHLLFTSAFPPHTSSADRWVKEWYGPGCRQLGARPEYAALSTLPGGRSPVVPGRRCPPRSSNSSWPPCCCRSRTLFTMT
ncbi:MULTISPECIES: hypothetical protein [Streptomyces]|uniref:hypothetical protein n=1 Tax=Streptomyces TaxID=1883 RepID=UPI001F0A6DFE|nr:MULTISPECIES: hypothetical protein [Streptomyces]